MALKVLIKEYPANGGPRNKGVDRQGNRFGPTERGAFRVAYWGRHKSHDRYSLWSSVRWGTPLRKSNGELNVYVDKQWKKLSDYTTLTETDILDEYKTLYGTHSLPSAWVFNDFGHLTIYLYRDLNLNQRFDPDQEEIHGEFIHTTPEDEAAASKNQRRALESSHGCVHVQPHDIDEMVQLGYVKRNTYVYVHPYDRRVIRYQRSARFTGPYEIHFYPGLFRICVIGQSK